ncbi:hypothetical protein PDG61_10105 [Mycolicibacterium sp. BiH015]|uniref:hypothetical protein n=1 Tax=Mycolicibacterium sp. BiH015 TaxID=3018808 RepID=UPI0022E51B21|nr:hypothetical protein [Mycolicibacterium sp. BiH015]MDA2891261.1 hypothetical protein [Mycolicibacterium sp. BiH015]
MIELATLAAHAGDHLFDLVGGLNVSTEDVAGEAAPPVAELGHVRLVVLSWADLVLDEENPRLEEGGETTRESINALIELDATKQINIARDIAESGTLSPFELPGVVVEGGLYVVVEGNRRVAALKMLKSPDLIDDLRIRKRVEAIIAANGTGPDDVACSVFANRESSRRWIELRHTGENDGRGLSPWTTDMSERFNPTPGSQTGLAMQLRDLMLDAYPDDDGLLKQLATIFRGGSNIAGTRVRRRVTTLGRLIAPKQMQEAFGYKIERASGAIRIVGPELAVHDAFRQIIFDVSEGLTARDINNQDLVATYIAGISHLKVADGSSDSAGSATPSPPTGQSGQSSNPPPSGGSSPPPPASGGGGGQQPTPTPPATPAGRRRHPRSERNIFQGLRLAKFQLRTSDTLIQAQRLDIDTMTLVASVMLRVIVELAVTEAIDKLGLTVTGNPTLRKKLEVVLRHLDPQIDHSRNRGPRLAAAWMDSQKDNATNGLGVDMMNAYVHSFTQSAGPTDVRTLSQTYRPLLEDLDGLI